MLKYKFDVLEALKDAGYSTYRIRKENLLGQATVQQLREGKVVGINAIDQICRLLDMQPGNIIKYVPDEEK